jgi:outer membrane PBP1 activator LpoA protein
MRLLLFFLLLLAVLSGCAPAPKPSPGLDTTADPELQARQFLQAGNFIEAADEYLRLSGEDKIHSTQYRLKAASAYIEAKDFEQAGKVLDMTEPDKSETIQMLQKTILQTRLALELGQPGMALESINITLPDDVPRSLRSAFHEIRARTYYENKNFPGAAKERLVLAAYLDTPEEIKDNQRQIWQSISSLQLPELENLRSTSSDTLASWMELAILYKTMLQNPKNFKNAVAAWMHRYPGHPAYEYIVPGLISESEQLVLQPDKIALLLPFRGQYQQASEAIRDGFLAAWFAAGDDKPVVNIYDANVININDVYQQAVNDGAEFIVGPLEKEAIASLAEQGNLSVTTLALNEYASGTNIKTNINPDSRIPPLIQFSLSPEDEARQVAERAWFDGHVLALVITPDIPWGDRIYDAFKSRWEQLGGKVLERASFTNESQDFSTPVKALLNIDSSERRVQQLKNKLGRKLKTESRRREDVDFIFIAAAPVAARQLMPQIRYYRAENVPVYSTSHVFSGTVDINKDNDINAINFVDIPWILDLNHEVSLIQQSLNRNWSQNTSSYRRLYAFGIDAYRLIPQLGKLSLHNTNRFEGETGELSMLENGRIERKLRWARFVDGRPVLLDDTNTLIPVID